MKINLDLKRKFSSIEICLKDRCIIITHWRWLIFSKVVIHNTNKED